MDRLTRVFTAAIHREEAWYVARCLELDVASQGRSIDEALANVAEVVELYLGESADVRPTPTPLVTSFQVPAKDI